MNFRIPKSEREVLNCLINPKYEIKKGHISELAFECNIPENIGNLRALEILSVSSYHKNYRVERIGNRLTSLPESFTNLKSLKDVNLRFNPLTSLPENIGNLKFLEELRLCSNHLSSLPESIGDLKSLKNLYLDNNNLTFLPESIGDLKSLKNLYLGNNKLTFLPESIGNLSSLEGLGLSKNQLSSIPMSFENLKSLVRLDLGNNQFTSFPESIGYLGSLINLSLGNNQFTSVPESIGNLKLLKYLYLNNTLLTYFPKGLNMIPEIIKLNLQENSIKSLSKISRNNFKCLSISVENLSEEEKFFYQNRKFNELEEYYSNFCKNLVLQYISNPKSLTEDEMARLFHEMCKNDEKIIENRLTLEDPLIRKILERDSLKLSNGFKIYL